MDHLVTRIYQQDLSGVDVEYLTKGKACLRMCKDLLEYKSIFESMKPYNNMILLLPTISDYEGHWVAVIAYPESKTITHFDSYGLSPSAELGYTSNKYVRERLLNNMYKAAEAQGWTCTWNKFKLQKMATGINTCGKWCCVRVRMSYLSDKEFATLFLNQRMPPDWYITAITLVALDDDEKEDTVEKILGLQPILDIAQ